jgi:hypothetical protein
VIPWLIASSDVSSGTSRELWALRKRTTAAYLTTAQDASEDARARIGEYRPDLIDLVGRVQGNRHRAQPEDAKIRAAPPGVVVGEEGAPGAGPASRGSEQAGGSVGPPSHVAVGIRVQSCTAEHLHCGPLRTSFRGREKQFDDVVHADAGGE